MITSFTDTFTYATPTHQEEKMGTQMRQELYTSSRCRKSSCGLREWAVSRVVDYGAGVPNKYKYTI